VLPRLGKEALDLPFQPRDLLVEALGRDPQFV